MTVDSCAGCTWRRKAARTSCTVTAGVVEVDTMVVEVVPMVEVVAEVATQVQTHHLFCIHKDIWPEMALLLSLIRL